MEKDQKKYGIGIVGCGNISETHAEAILRTGKGKLVAAYSRTKATVEAFGEKYNIQGITSFDEFLEIPGLDIVVICTPTGTHLDYGRMAADAEKHVIVEKPIEITVERGQSLIDSCNTNGVKLAVIYQSRFIEDVIQMKQLLEGDAVGKVVMASASVKWFRSREYYSDSTWRGTLSLDGGGAVINQSVHTIDLLQWFAGGVKSVSAFKGTFTHEGIEAEDNAVACLEYNNGAIGVFEASTSITPPQERALEINGSKGTLILEGDTLVRKLDSQNEQGNENTGTSSDAAGAASPLAGMSFKNHKKQYEAILDAFLHNTKPIVSGEDSLQSLAIVEALYRSAEIREAVYIDDILSWKKTKQN